MYAVNQLKADNIRSISTKFFYKNENLNFQIMIAYNGRYLYCDFEDYDAYKEEHNKLVSAMNNNTILENRFSPVYLEKAS